MTISYKKDQGEIYLDNIKYTYTSNGTLDCYQITFYRETRTDVVVSYVPKFQVITASRLKTVDILTKNDGRVRAYGLSYTPSTSPSARSQLTGFQEYGSDARINNDGVVIFAGATTVPATSLGWQQGGDGTFYGAAGGIGPFPPSLYCGNVVQTGDFNGDGLTDVVKSSISLDSYLNYTLYIDFFQSKGDGTFQELKLLHRTIFLGSYPNYVFKLGDFNGDGLTDFVLGYYANNSYVGPYVHVSLGNGTFLMKNTNAGMPSGSSYGTVSSWYPGDFNGDGITDILAWEGSTSTVSAYISKGDGTFVKKGIVYSGYFDFGHHGQIALGDFNGDGVTDFLLRPDKGYGWYVYRANGDGTFTCSSGLSYTVCGLVVGDFNGDGLTDALMWFDESGWYLYFAKGDGTFDTNNKYFCGYKNVIDAVGDFNGDGLTDVVVRY